MSLVNQPANLFAGIPDGYYSTAEGKSGTALKTALYNIIKGHTEYPYTSDNPDVWDGIQDIDEDTANSNNVILLYTGRSQEKDYLDHGYDWDYTQYDDGNGIYDNAWNREHVWAKSHGDFGTDMGPGTDLHHLRPADRTVNSTRNNLDFDNGGNAVSGAAGCYYDSDSFEPRDAVKGDIARMLFYMATRYEGENGEPDLELVDSVLTWTSDDASRPYHGKLSTLLQWHEQDPVDNWERIRNDKIYTNWQHNRNPFIDHPEYVALIWESDTSDTSGSSNPDAPTTLSAGDIVIIGVNCDDPDDFAFVPLIDLGTGTTINFTDNGWLSTNTFRTGEGIKTYTAPSAIPSGMVIVYSENSSNFTSSGSFALSASGDQLIAYQGTADSPTMIYAVNIKGSAVWQSTASDANTSALPLGLINGTNCVALTEKDNVMYSGSVTVGKAAVLAAVSNKDNWVGDDATRYDFTTISDYSLPVSLTEFKAKVCNGMIHLSWRTESETENLGFIIERRSMENGGWEEIASYTTTDALAGHGSTPEAHEYYYLDETVVPGVTYAYRLGDVDYAGAVTWHKEIEVKDEAEDEQVPTGFGLQRAYPNPFNPRTTISYHLPETEFVKITVYDLKGRPIAFLLNEKMTAGVHRLDWEPHNLISGIYLIQMQAGPFVSVRKCILLK